MYSITSKSILQYHISGLSIRLFIKIFFTLDLSMAATGPYNYSYIFKYIIIGKCNVFLGRLYP